MQIASKLQFASMNPSRFDEKEKTILLEEIDVLLKNAWGKFDINFLENHTLISEQITTARIGGELIGFCALSKKKINSKSIYS